MSSTSQSGIKTKKGFNRRAFLGLVWLAGLGVLLARLSDIGLKFSVPRRKIGEYGGVFEAGPVKELPAPGEAPVKYPKGRFWLVRTGEGILALSNICTHLDCLMDWDDLSGDFVCPCHGSQFSLDGQYVMGPAPRSLYRFVIQLVDAEGAVVAETDPQTGAPLFVGDSNESEDDVSAEDVDAETYQNPYADLSVWVDTGRKITGPAVGEIL